MGPQRGPTEKTQQVKWTELRTEIRQPLCGGKVTEDMGVSEKLESWEGRGPGGEWPRFSNSESVGNCREMQVSYRDGARCRTAMHGQVDRGWQQSSLRRGGGNQRGRWNRTGHRVQLRFKKGGVWIYLSDHVLSVGNCPSILRIETPCEGGKGVWRHSWHTFFLTENKFLCMTCFFSPVKSLLLGEALWGRQWSSKGISWAHQRHPD